MATVIRLLDYFSCFTPLSVLSLN